ncbi:MAG: cytochrome c-type biogenesis protein CcmH [Myxococcota bacterium]
MRLFAFAFTVFVATSALAEPPGRRAVRIERAIMSPFCPSKTLHDCPSPRAASWRADIRAWIDRGDTDAAIVQQLQARAPGADLQGRPSGAADWAIPLGAAALVTLVLLFALRRLRSADDEDVPRAPRDAYDDRLDAELERT